LGWFSRKTKESLLTNRTDSYIVATPMIMNKTLTSNSGKGTVSRKMADFERLCRDNGLRVTPQRLAIYRLLIMTDEHPSAEWVFRRVRQEYPSISFDTVNRTLLTLARIGAAFVVEGSGEAKRFDGGRDSHQHFRCVRCRRIVDFHHEPFDDIEVPDAIGRFTVLRKSVYFEGICDCCEKVNETENTNNLTEVNNETQRYTD
jgi:Fur family peroxide stress response transcriptional regulator